MKNQTFETNFINKLEQFKDYETKEEYYCFISGWLNQNRYKLTKDGKYDKELEMLISLNLHRFHLQELICIKDEVNRFRLSFKGSTRVKPCIITMILRDTLIDLVSIRGIDCPNCDYSLGMVYWKRTCDNSIFMECMECCWMQDVSGLPFSIKDDDYMPATLIDLYNANIINSI